MKDRLKTEQPVVYRTLKNGLENNRLSHALLFTGVRGTPKLETAVYLAQSLVCQRHQGFACRVCGACQRTAAGQYADVKLLDGSEKSIKKDEILKVQEEFNKTALEGGQKVYILNRAENATPEALNSLLKFLEEPSGENTTAILIAEESERVLPTIVSRCQILPFHPLSFADCFNQAKKLGVSNEDSFLLAHFIKDPKEIKETAESESYQKALAAIRYFLSNVVRLDEALIFLEAEIFDQKDSFKETLILFIDLLSSILQDTAACQETSISWLEREMEKLRSLNIDLGAWLMILSETRDKCGRPFHTGLLLEQMILEMKEKEDHS